MIKFEVSKDSKLPRYESELASGFDVMALTIKTIYKGSNEAEKVKIDELNKSFISKGWMSIRGYERILFGTGLIVADIESKNIELQVRSRSGISLKKGLFVANQPGTIDADYRGEINVIIYNSTAFPIRVSRFEKIAQIVICPIFRMELVESDTKTITKRGANGFGSTS